MISKIAVITLFCALLFASPVLATDSTTSAKVPALKQKVEQKIENRENKITQKIEDVKVRIASKEAELKTKLLQFKDRKKADLAEKINTNLNKINQNRTNEMLNNLVKMTAILDKLEARVNTGKPDIKDPTLAKTAIEKARASIASASSAVKAQSQKAYSIPLTTEARIKADTQKIRLQLQADLQAVRKQVIDAKQSVSNAIRTAKSGQITEKEATASGRE